MLCAAKTIAIGLGTLLASAACVAGSQSGAFNVNISLLARAELCVSETLNARAGVMVQVACRTGQFVDISVPAGSSHTVIDSAYRLHFGPGLFSSPESAGPIDELPGSGSITSLRIIRAEQGGEPLTMLVTF